MEWYVWVLTILGGFAAGFINTLAGSGSLITLPILIFLGLPANVANGTNRVGALLQTIVSVITFKRRGNFDLKGSQWLIFPAVLGSIPGALIAVDLNEEVMTYTIGSVMLLMLAPVMTNRSKWLRETSGYSNIGKGWIVFVFSMLGAYGGFIQTGVGIFLLSAMVLIANYSVNHSNVLKNVIVLCYTLPTIIIFIVNGQVNWVFGLLMASGQMLGSWIAARFAMEHEGANSWVRILLVLMIVVSAIELFGLRGMIIDLF